MISRKGAKEDAKKQAFFAAFFAPLRETNLSFPKL